MKTSSISRTLFVIAAILITAWWLYPHIAESAHTPADAVVIQPLIAPAGFTAADEDPETAFREAEAGFSAYYRVPAPAGAEGQSESERLNVGTITSALTSPPGSSEEIRTGAGEKVDIGLNFGIIKLPMRAAVTDSHDPTETITVYYDDQGWVVAYLPKGTPAAAIWKYKSMGDTTNDETELKNNLLVLAINEVLKADNAATISPSNVKYYDWEYKACNAFVLFSAVTKDGESSPVKFVVPSKITGIQASAAVVIAGQIDDGSDVTATVLIDEAEVARA